MPERSRRLEINYQCDVFLYLNLKNKITNERISVKAFAAITGKAFALIP